MASNVPPELEEKFRSCKEKVMASGQDEESAYGICYAAIVEGKADALASAKAAGFILDDLPEDALKIGARNSRQDQERLQQIHEFVVQNGAVCNTRKAVEDDTPLVLDDDKTFVHSGDAVKALPDGKVGGYLIRFTPEGDTDLTGDFFTKETDLGEPIRLPVIYHHGLDETLKRRRIGTADTKVDEIGLWVEAQLALRDEYEQKIYAMAQAGKLGWSSGAAAHVTEKIPTGKGMRITQWYIAEASLTPVPAEPRNTVITLKAYLSDNTAIQTPEGKPETAQAVASEGGAENADTKSLVTPQGEKEQDKMEITPELLQQSMADVAAKAASEAVKVYRESEPPVKTAEANLTVVKDEGDQPWKSAGDFFSAVKIAAFRPDMTDPRLTAKAISGSNETVPSQGGFLVPPTIAGGIMEKVYKVGSLLSKLSVDPVEGNRMTYNVVDETSRANGSRYGGITSYWLEEGGSKTVTKPAFRQLDVVLNKITALCVATDELLADQGALQSWLGRTVPDELRFRVEDAVINGTGVGMPLGILSNGAALTSCTRTDASEIDALDIGRMWAARYAGADDYIWLVNAGVFPQLLNLVIGQQPMFLPAGGLSGMPYATLLGRPLLELEYCPALGTAGDIILFAPSQYAAIQKSSGIESASSIHVYFSTDETCYRWVYRFGGCPTWNAQLTGFDSATYSPYIVLTAST